MGGLFRGEPSDGEFCGQCRSEAGPGKILAWRLWRQSLLEPSWMGWRCPTHCPRVRGCQDCRYREKFSIVKGIQVTQDGRRLKVWDWQWRHLVWNMCGVRDNCVLFIRYSGHSKERLDETKSDRILAAKQTVTKFTNYIYRTRTGCARSGTGDFSSKLVNRLEARICSTD